jgi:DNA repair photolyase
MGLKKSTGNMYPWVTHTHTHLGGECPHKCVYCYVDNPRSGRPARYRGPLRLIEEEFAVNYGNGKTIFIENCNDLWAREVPHEFILRVLAHCKTWPDNTFVFQTKNTFRYSDFFEHIPANSVLGVTIETNRNIPDIGKAPSPSERLTGMLLVTRAPFKKFITIEPVLDFDVEILAEWINRIHPDFLNLGADSKDHGLPEPTVEKIFALVDKLKTYGIELREKHNLQRLTGTPPKPE